MIIIVTLLVMCLHILVLSGFGRLLIPGGSTRGGLHCLDDLCSCDEASGRLRLTPPGGAHFLVVGLFFCTGGDECGLIMSFMAPSDDRRFRCLVGDCLCAGAGASGFPTRCGSTRCLLHAVDAFFWNGGGASSFPMSWITLNSSRVLLMYAFAVTSAMFLVVLLRFLHFLILVLSALGVSLLPLLDNCLCGVFGRSGLTGFAPGGMLLPKIVDARPLQDGSGSLSAPFKY